MRCVDADESEPKSKLKEIAGSSLSSVEFVHNYIQFRFDGPCLTTITLPSIRRTKGEIAAADQGYRDALCSQIGNTVEDVIVTPEELIVSFTDSTALVVSLRDEDYTGPEAINYIAEDGTQVVI